MNTVRLHEKTFRSFITAAELAAQVEVLAQRLGAMHFERPPLVLGILNGAVLFHADLIRKCPFALEVAYLRTRSYSGMRSTGSVKIDWPQALEFAGRDVVIVEDIVDSGLTLSELSKALVARQVKSITTVVLLDKEEARTTPFVPDLRGFVIPDAFVVGYGLDYNGLGRNLPEIYQLVL